MSREKATIVSGSYSSPLCSLEVARGDCFSDIVVCVGLKKSVFRFDLNGRFVHFENMSAHREKPPQILGNSEEWVVVCDHVSPGYADLLYVERDESGSVVCAYCSRCVELSPLPKHNAQVRVMSSEVWKNTIKPSREVELG